MLVYRVYASLSSLFIQGGGRFQSFFGRFGLYSLIWPKVPNNLLERHILAEGPEQSAR